MLKTIAGQTGGFIGGGKFLADSPSQMILNDLVLTDGRSLEDISHYVVAIAFGALGRTHHQIRHW